LHSPFKPPYPENKGSPVSRDRASFLRRSLSTLRNQENPLNPSRCHPERASRIRRAAVARQTNSGGEPKDLHFFVPSRNSAT
jgi:hypothetical protein